MITLTKPQMDTFMEEMKRRNVPQNEALNYLHNKGVVTEGYDNLENSPAVKLSSQSSIQSQGQNFQNPSPTIVNSMPPTNATHDFTAGALSGGVSSGANLLGTLVHFLQGSVQKGSQSLGIDTSNLPEWAQKLGSTDYGQAIQQGGQDISNAITNFKPTDTSSMAYQTGQTMGKIAVPAAATIAMGQPELSANVAEGLMAKGVPQFLSKMGGAVATSPISTTAMTASQEGQLPTKGQLIGYGAIDALLPPLESILGATWGGAKHFMKWVATKGASPSTSALIQDVAKNGSEADKSLFKELDAIGQATQNAGANKVLTPNSLIGDKIYAGYQTMIKAKRAIGKQMESVISNAKSIAQPILDDTVTAFNEAISGIGAEPSILSQYPELGRAQSALAEIQGKVASIPPTDFKNSLAQFSDSSQTALTKIYDKLNSWASGKIKVSQRDYWNLTRAIDDLKPTYKPGVTNQVIDAVDIPLQKLTDAMRENLGSMNKGFGKLSSDYSSLAKPTTTLNRAFGEEGVGGEAIVNSLFNPSKRSKTILDAVQSLSDFNKTDYAKQAEMSNAIHDIYNIGGGGFQNMRSLPGSLDSALATALTSTLFDKTKLADVITKEVNLTPSVAAQVASTIIKYFGTSSGL